MDGERQPSILGQMSTISLGLAVAEASSQTAKVGDAGPVGAAAFTCEGCAPVERAQHWEATVKDMEWKPSIERHTGA